VRPHHNLDVWKRSVEFVVEIYQVTESFPKDERFGLISQIRRAAVSIPANISEGAARRTNKEFLQFLAIAQGSASEIETELLISYKLGFLAETQLGSLNKTLDDIGRMLTGLSSHIAAKRT
jgi:four helix bundle protein